MRDNGEDRKRKEEAKSRKSKVSKLREFYEELSTSSSATEVIMAKPKKRHSTSKSRKSNVSKLREVFEEPSTTSSAIEVIMEVVPTKGKVSKLREMYEEPSTTSSAIEVIMEVVPTKGIRESTDDGMDEIDSLVLMLAKEGYYFPAHFDWRFPRSQLLRKKISLRLKLDLKWHRFLAKCVRELYLVEEDKTQWATLDELDDQLQLTLVDGSVIDYSSSLHSYQPYVTCVSALIDSDNCDSFVTVVSEDDGSLNLGDKLKNDSDKAKPLWRRLLSYCSLDDERLSVEEDETQWATLDQLDDQLQLTLMDGSVIDYSSSLHSYQPYVTCVSALTDSDSFETVVSEDAIATTSNDETQMLEAFEDDETIDDSCLDQSDDSCLDQSDDSYLDQSDASEEEDGTLNLGDKLKNDSDKAKPWWRRLLSYCSVL